jgi:hypothetical protein
MTGLTLVFGGRTKERRNKFAATLRDSLVIGAAVFNDLRSSWSGAEFKGAGLPEKAFGTRRKTGHYNGKIGSMAKIERKKSREPREEPSFGVKKRKPVPHEFVLEALSLLSPRTNPMFGCLAVYVGEKIVLILRDRPKKKADNGVWLATTQEHHESLRREFPSMRSIRLLGKKVTGWQVLPADAADFEEAALRACELILAKDPRIGKVPKSRRRAR